MFKKFLNFFSLFNVVKHKKLIDQYNELVKTHNETISKYDLLETKNNELTNDYKKQEEELIDLSNTITALNENNEEKTAQIKILKNNISSISAQLDMLYNQLFVKLQIGNIYRTIGRQLTETSYFKVINEVKNKEGRILYVVKYPTGNEQVLMVYKTDIDYNAREISNTEFFILGFILNRNKGLVGKLPIGVTSDTIKANYNETNLFSPGDHVKNYIDSLMKTYPFSLGDIDMIAINLVEAFIDDNKEKRKNKEKNNE